MSRQLNNIYYLLERIDSQYKDYVLLTESQESKSISKAKRLLREKRPIWSEEEIDKFVRKDLRDMFSALNYNSNAGKFIYGLTRMYCDGELTDGGQIARLNATIRLIAAGHVNEYDQNLNGMSANDLINRFAGARQEMGNKDREEVSALDLQENNDYTIVQIDNLEQASKYAQYTDWCVTRSQDMIDRYTSGGIGQFYFCLKNGFENVPREKGEGCPLDEYGLSMVSVVVDGDGDLIWCTCRWNHANGGNDNIMDTKQVSQLIGRNFYDVFKPNDKWKKKLDYALSQLEEGLELTQIFDYVDDAIKGLKYVKLASRWNFITKDRKLLFPNQWFDGASSFYEGCCCVRVGEQYNYITVKGNLLSPNEWFDWCNDFDDGFGSVEKNGFYNLIDKNGKLLSPKQWLDEETTFVNGLARIKINNKVNYINKRRKLLSPDLWFDDGHYFYNEAPTFVTLNGKANFLKMDGQLLSPDLWFDNVQSDSQIFLTEDWAHVVLNDKHNFINEYGIFISRKQWFDDARDFDFSHLAKVKIGDKWNFLKKDGTYVSEMWFDEIIDDSPDFLNVIVKKDEKYNMISRNEKKFVFDQWFDFLGKIKESFVVGIIGKNMYLVSYNGKYTPITKEQFSEMLRNAFDVKKN